MEEIRKIVREVISNPLNEFELYIDEVFNSIKESDESSPTFEWDIAKEKIDSAHIKKVGSVSSRIYKNNTIGISYKRI